MRSEPSASDIPSPGERLVVTIDALAAGGDGIARPGGFTLFIPDSAPGDVAEVEVTQVAKSYGRARIVALHAAGPDRVVAPCPLAGQCAGCALQHLRYSAQLEAKRTFVKDGLERIGHLRGITVSPTLGMDHPWAYRNKGEFTAVLRHGQFHLGYHIDEGDGFLPVAQCPIQHPISMRIAQAMEEIATARHLPLAQLITRVSPHTDTALAILVVWEWHEGLPEAATALREQVPEVVGVLWSRVRGRSVVRRTLAEPLVGQTRIIQRLGAWDFTVSAESFFQVNNEQATRLIDLAATYSGDLASRILLDGYCGVGTFLIPLGQHAARAIGVEEHPIALRDAETNLSRYARHDTKLYEGRVEVILPRLIRKGREIDVVVLDPPRKGAGREVLAAVAELGAERIVLVSCDPATLGRDAGDLAALGYRLQVVQPVDMFPQTWHVETIALAVRG